MSSRHGCGSQGNSEPEFRLVQSPLRIRLHQGHRLEHTKGSFIRPYHSYRSGCERPQRLSWNLFSLEGLPTVSKMNSRPALFSVIQKEMFHNATRRPLLGELSPALYWRLRTVHLGYYRKLSSKAVSLAFEKYPASGSSSSRKEGPLIILHGLLYGFRHY